MPSSLRSIALAALLTACAALPAAGQDSISEEALRPRSTKAAFGLSLLVPGLGHRYVHEGRWTRAATFFGLTDAATWAGLLGVGWQERQFVQSYETLAAQEAGAQIEGRDRAFFLNLGIYDSSTEYVEGLLRARAWDRIDAARAPEVQWAWTSEDARLRYRALRADADRMGRRRTLLISVLVANRFVSAVTALRAAQRRNARVTAGLSFLPPLPGSNVPAARLVVRF